MSSLILSDSEADLQGGLHRLRLTVPLASSLQMAPGGFTAALVGSHLSSDGKPTLKDLYLTSFLIPLRLMMLSL